MGTTKIFHRSIDVNLISPLLGHNVDNSQGNLRKGKKRKISFFFLIQTSHIFTRQVAYCDKIYLG